VKPVTSTLCHRYRVVMDLEYQRLYLPPGTDRRTAQTVLTLHAEYGDWELERLRLLPDGSRRAVLRRRRRPPGSAGASFPSYLPT
jgi:hypothetical protein